MRKLVAFALLASTLWASAASAGWLCEFAEYWRWQSIAANSACLYEWRFEHPPEI